jgi:hypothetical protein
MQIRPSIPQGIRRRETRRGMRGKFFTPSSATERHRERNREEAKRASRLVAFKDFAFGRLLPNRTLPNG